MRESAKVAVLGVLLCGFMVAGCFDELLEIFPDDDWGNNHSFDNAADITAEQLSDVAGALITSPEDWFKFDAADTAMLTIICTPGIEVADIVLTLYDFVGTPLTTGDDGTSILGAQTISYMGGGSGTATTTYYISIEYIGVAGGDAYVLTWDAQ